MYEKLKNLLFGSLRKQLIVGMSLVIATLMALFVITLTHRQLQEDTHNHTQQLISLAESTAVSSSVWVSSKDYSGLQEIVLSIARYPNLRYIIVMDTRGQIVAHNDPSKIGLHLTDLPIQTGLTTLNQTPSMIDVISPIKFTGKHIGWVRLGIDRRHFNEVVAETRQQGFVFTLIGVLLSIMIASLVANYLTRRLASIQRVADGVNAGQADARVSLLGNDEAAILARQFNDMLDSLAQRDAQLRSFYEFDIVGLAITSPEKGWIRINQCLCNMLEYSEQELRGMTWDATTHPDDLPASLEQYNKLLANEISLYSLEKRFISKSGKVIPVLLVARCIRKANGEVDYVTAMFQDISARKEAEKAIETLAYFDPLTKLPNRRLFMDRLHTAFLNSNRNNLYGAVLFIDMDKFKVLNDTLGHDSGDMMLIQVAQRIQGCIREVDTVARFGGDEFLVLLADVDASTDKASQRVATVAEKIRTALTKPYNLKDREYISSPSIGIALYRGLEKSVDDLLKHADMAMYQVKDSGRNAVRFFDPSMQLAVETRASLESDLRQAITHHQLQLYYQIQVDQKHRPIGAEALLRWNHPTRGLVPPAQFIPVAEQSSAIIEIGDWVMETACRQLAAWAKADHTNNLIIAVNVSALQFSQPDFVSKVDNLLHTTGIEASKLKLELTESVVLTNTADVINKMFALKALNVKLSMDDFGTGYSSLSYLKQFPLDQLKIDQSFVRDMTTDPNDAVMVQTIIDLAKNFRLSVIAEGVETEEQLSLLLHQGCLTYQGYLFGKPLPIAQFEALLKHD
ncbi:MAG: EAL domain-containing protein [Sideroxydans sp.]|nr:EAL domain-containing protein [Sideroxydans sp.]